jgi:hypothetical protein
MDEDDTPESNGKRNNTNAEPAATGDSSGAISWMPDVPILRDVTQRELNLFVVGIWPGAGVALLLAGQKLAPAAGIVVSFLERLRQGKDTQDASGPAGYIRDASSLALGAIVGLVIGLLMVTLFGGGLTLPAPVSEVLA